MLSQLKKELQEFTDEQQAEICQRFFKTGKGEYGEGDIFLGLNVPVQRKIAKKYSGMPLVKVQELLNSEIHEHRFIALVILIKKYERGNKENIFQFYLENIKFVNNWDLVDVSSHKIIGDFLQNKDKKILYELVRSENLWERRIAIISTFAFIKQNEFEDVLAISELLLGDNHDLIHKAVGWMLREVGKREQEILENFLRQHYKNIPRTTLRYAIEKFEEGERKKWLRGEIK